MFASQLLAIPFAALNYFGFFCGAVWLAILGKWGLLGIGIVSTFISAAGLALVLIPGTLAAMMALPFLDRPLWSLVLWLLGFPFILTGSIYTAVVIGAWCLSVITVCVTTAGEGAMLPALLWAYGVAVAPLSYLTLSRGPNKDTSTGNVLMTCFAQFSMLLMGIISLFGGFFLPRLVLTCVMIMGVATLLHAIMTFVIMKQLVKEAGLDRLLSNPEFDASKGTNG
jgi:hypothetical protein